MVWICHKCGWWRVRLAFPKSKICSIRLCGTGFPQCHPFSLPLTQDSQPPNSSQLAFSSTSSFLCAVMPQRQPKKTSQPWRARRKWKSCLRNGKRPSNQFPFSPLLGHPFVKFRGPYPVILMEFWAFIISSPLVKKSQSFCSSKWCVVESFHNFGSLCKTSAKIIDPFCPGHVFRVNSLFPFPSHHKCNLAGFVCFTWGSISPAQLESPMNILWYWLLEMIVYLVNILVLLLLSFHASCCANIHPSCKTPQKPIAAPPPSLAPPILHLRNLLTDIKVTNPMSLGFPISPQPFTACCHVAGRHLTTHSGANHWSMPVGNNGSMRPYIFY